LTPLSPSAVHSPQAGLRFSKSAGHLFRPIFLDDVGSILLWDREFAGLFSKSPALRQFLPDVEFSEGGDEVIFSRFESGRDVLTDTLGLDQGAPLPRRLYQQLRKAEADFKRLADSGMLTEQQASFARAFVLPDPIDFPSAYRVRKAGVFSRKKLYVLWGMVPERPRAQPTIRMGGAFVPGHGYEPAAGLSSDGGADGLSSSLEGNPEPEVVEYDDTSDWPRWLQFLLWLIGILLLLAIFSLLYSILLSGCKKEQPENAVLPPMPPKEEPINPVPSIEERKAQLGRRLEDLQRDADSPSAREQFKATEDALKRQDQALRADRAYEQANRSAEAAEKKALESNDPADRRAAAELKAEAEARKAEAYAAEKKSEDAFRAPQETARQEKADALGRQTDVMDVDKEYKKADALASEARAKADKSGEPADKEKAAELKSKAAQLKDKADDTLKRAQDAAKSPEEKRNLDALRDASPEEQEKIAKQREDLNSKRYVVPKNSPQEGEVLVRRFKPDEIVPKGGLRLHVEADANGRRDFKVKGWRLGLSPFVATERLEEFVPIGPDLDIDVPLDLSFEYRGRDGKIHEDTAPFTLQGDLTIVPRVKIRKFKESDGASQQKPIPKEKFDPKRGA